MNYKDVLQKASQALEGLKGETINVLTLAKPEDMEYAQNLVKVISKISPLIGNMIEFSVVNILNKMDWKDFGKWRRQDPDFPDTLFETDLKPQPGFEIKTWFPLATEITARFKDSITRFQHDEIYVAVIAWLPEFIIYGKPKIIDVWIGSAKKLAIDRDKHYHNPPGYLVFEPEDTTSRTRNLQQTNTNGYKFQGTPKQLKELTGIIRKWGRNYASFKPTKEYQGKIKKLLGRYPYRLDTNFAKIDRIENASLEKFKIRVLNTKMNGIKIKDWSKYIAQGEDKIKSLFK